MYVEVYSWFFICIDWCWRFLVCFDSFIFDVFILLGVIFCFVVVGKMVWEVLLRLEYVFVLFVNVVKLCKDVSWEMEIK